MISAAWVAVPFAPVPTAPLPLVRRPLADPPRTPQWRTPTNALGLAAAFANFSGCPQKDMTQAAACLRKLDSATLLAAQKLVEGDVATDLDALLQVRGSEC